MVLEAKHFSAYVPFAARWPLEVHLVPHRQRPRPRGAHGRGTRRTFARLPRPAQAARSPCTPRPLPYISAWHQAPLDPALRPAGQLHLQLTSPRRAADKLKYLAGSEAAMGAFINDTTPEAVAERLRSVAAAPASHQDPGRHPSMTDHYATAASSPPGSRKRSAQLPTASWQAPGRVNLIGEHTDTTTASSSPWRSSRDAPWWPLRVARRLDAPHAVHVRRRTGWRPSDLVEPGARPADGWAGYALGRRLGAAGARHRRAAASTCCHRLRRAPRAPGCPPPRPWRCAVDRRPRSS